MTNQPNTTVSSAAAGDVVTGNTYDKYGSTNPVARALMDNFLQRLDQLLKQAAPASILDIGCGEGVLTHQWACEDPARRVVGIDLEDADLNSHWENRKAPNLEYMLMKAENLPFKDSEFELATAIEVLEHVPDPEHTVAEMARCASRHLLLSVPREPTWRMVNMARGAYWPQLGNTPGHVNHWSKRSFKRFVGEFGQLEEVRSPFPWTMLLVRL